MFLIQNDSDKLFTSQSRINISFLLQEQPSALPPSLSPSPKKILSQGILLEFIDKPRMVKVG